MGESHAFSQLEGRRRKHWTLLIHQFLGDLGAKLRSPRPCLLHPGWQSYFIFPPAHVTKAGGVKCVSCAPLGSFAVLQVLPELWLCFTRFTKPLKGKFQLPRSPGRSLSHPGGSVLLPVLLLVDFPEPGLDKLPVMIISCHSQQLTGNHLDLIPEQVLPGPQQQKALPLPWQRSGGPKNSRGMIHCPILPCFQWDPGCCCGQRGQRALGVFLVHLGMLTELLQGIRAEVSVSYRLLQPQPGPSGAELQLLQLESWQGCLCIPSQGESCSLQDPCTQQSP